MKSFVASSDFKGYGDSNVDATKVVMITAIAKTATKMAFLVL